MTSDQLRVLFVTKGLDIGGIERIVVDLSVGLRQRGFQAEVAVVNDARDQLVGLLETAGVVVHRLGGSDHFGIQAILRLRKLIHAGRFDVIHAHGPLPSVVVRCLHGRVPTVGTSHTVWPALRKLTRVLWRSTWRRDAVIVAVSSVVAQSLPRVAARSCQVLPHGVNDEAIESVLQSVPLQPRAGVRAICVASHRDVKNYPNLLRSFALARAAVPSLSLTAVGDGPDIDRHRSLAAELGLGDAISFEPATVEVLELMRQADMLVVASDFEGQPMVVMEAMGLGLPVVATAVGRVPELLTPAEGRIVAPGDSRALSEAIVELAESAKLREELGRNAMAASRAWTLRHALDAHEALYASIGSRLRQGG